MLVLTKRYNPVINKFYNHLENKGKPYKVSNTAAMRKLLIIIRSVCQKGTHGKMNWV